ncbi:HmuY family protein [Sphingobacterium tabacisoli]|uniref:HmuY family protein n=1 Tax=Sphingobacterium tabacisoli TaxID=2044855 RepID=A0ABW5L850_9SPHI|nr:HmuY family protein [Sphingobacterium tabacisoli]
MNNIGYKTIPISAILLAFVTLSSCYKLQDLTPDYQDGYSTVIFDLPGDTLASDGWEQNYEAGDVYLRQRYFTTKNTDSIRFVSQNQEFINAAAKINGSSDEDITWLANMANHPTSAQENTAYKSTSDGKSYLFRSGQWYQMDIDGHLGIEQNDGIAIDWRGALQTAPANPQIKWVYADNDNGRVYLYNGKAWTLMVNNADYRDNRNFIQVEYSKSGKETGKYSIFTFRFSDRKQQFIRDAADSLRYLTTADWDIAFTGDMNSHIWLNNATYNLNPGFGGPITKSALIPYDYGYDFMDEAPDDDFFDSRPAEQAQISYTSEYGPGINPWYEYGSTFIAKPFPYRAYYLRLEQADGSYRYGKLQLISMYRGAPEALTDRNWPSPYLTFRYFIQKDGSRNIRTKN